MSPRFAVLCVVFLHYFTGSVDGFTKTLTTSGRDVTHELTLSVPVNLYGEYHTSLFIHSRGFLALGKDVKRIDVNRFQQHTLIVPFYNEIYLRKTVLIETTQDSDRLNAFSKTVRTHFSSEDEFQADEIVSVTWKVYVTFSPESMQTITLLIGSNKDKSYAEIKYEHSKSKYYENFLYFFYGTHIAGFSSGDDVRYHRIYGKFANDLFTDILSKLSNIASPGRWMFKLGGSIGVNKNFAVSLPDAKLDGDNVVDNDECSEGVSQCHQFASCTNRNLGYICQCNDGYIGNGKICLKKDFRVYVRGTIHGQVNDHLMPESDHTILVQPSGVVAVTVIPLKEQLGGIFRLLPMIHGLIPWLFAKSDSEKYGKGFDIVGDRFVAKTLINFLGDPNELYITQKMKGFANGRLALHTNIYGNTPNFGKIKTFEISNLTEVFAESSPGSTRSISQSTMQVNGIEYKLRVSRLITYEPSLKKVIDLKHQLHINFDAATYSSYSNRSGLYMKFDANIKNIKVTDHCEGNPCGNHATCLNDKDGYKCVCNPGYKERDTECIALTSCSDNPCGEHTNCVDKRESFVCECLPGFEKRDGGEECVAITSCSDNRCGEHSTCVDTRVGFVCECLPGYEKGDGGSCVDIDECSTGRACSSVQNTQCANTEGSYQCECTNGYKRSVDGCVADTVVDCRNNPCGDKSDCVELNGVFSCLCKPGFQKRGSTCVDIDECSLGRACVSAKNTRCENRVGGYACVCKDGFQRTADGCVAERSRGCLSDPCGDNSKCLDKSDGTYSCECNKGYVKVGETCTDINECATPDICALEKNTICVNSEGSYKCECDDGYKRTAEGCKADERVRTCKDVDCGANSKCFDKAEGGYECVCDSGFENTASGCTDIDECSSGRACASVQNTRCENKVGSYNCVCKDGFQRTADGCVAATGCKGNPCGDGGKCVDGADGSYTCTCVPGYEKSGSQCVDIDECSIYGSRACASAPNTKCQNRPGSYRCVCRDGYKRTAQGCEPSGSCKDNPCGPNSKCEDKDGGFTCKCNSGYEKRGSLCVDIDECQQSDACLSEKNSMCVNNDGRYECVCNKGFTKTSEGCEAETGCNLDSLESCGDNGKCVQTSTGTECQCNRGFSKRGSSCVDIDECESGRACVSVKYTRCENRVGSYACVCEDGYERTATGCVGKQKLNCRDTPCGENSKCVEEDGKYSCKCNPGFKKSDSGCVAELSCTDESCGDNAKCQQSSTGSICQCNPGFQKQGSACVDIDECTIEGACAANKNTRCENRAGGYACVCKNGFKRTAEGCVASQPCQDKPCGENSICVEKDGTYSCVCDPGFTKRGSECISEPGCTDESCGTNSKCVKSVTGPTCQCEPGFERQGASCVDIDECNIEGACASTKNTRCENRDGGYACVCQDGFKRTAEGCVARQKLSCRDNPCGDNSKCEEEDGGYKCKCDPGFEKRDSACVDIDECSIYGSRACASAPNTICQNTPGSYRCVCRDGFKRTATGCEATGTCKDKPCGANAQCIDIDGGFLCKCNIGYEKGGAGCVDINECEAPICATEENTKCVNNEGGYDCVCNDGFVKGPEGCKAVTICSENSCGEHSICVDTRAGFKCECKPGFEKRDGDCVAIEVSKSCKDKPCGKNMDCTDLPSGGGYTCSCIIGFVKHGSDCVAVTSCSDRPCGEHSNCVDTRAGFICECESGFEKQDGERCVDKDECATRNACEFVKNTKCENRVGTYTCVCLSGYKRTEGGCKAEADDCRNNPCDQNSKCVYEDGAYSCQCKKGFEERDSVCVDTDECNGLNACVLDPNLKCVNNVGGYECKCKAGYKEKDDGTCEALQCECGDNEECVILGGQEFCRCKEGYEIYDGACLDKDECVRGDYDCPSNSKCENTVGGYTCECSSDYTKSGNMCINFARFKGVWSLIYTNRRRDMYAIGSDGQISVKSQAGRTTSRLEPSDNEKAFPSKDGWFLAKHTIRPDTWEYIRMMNDGTLEVHHFCSNGGCDKEFGPGAPKQYCCAAIAKKPLRDIDECATDSHNCTGNFKCINTIGSYKCECKIGFIKNVDQCDDLDECVYNICGDEAKCINTVGSYICQCNPGFRKVGSVCTDINECDNEDSCGKYAVCINTEGGFECNCPVNYVFGANGKDCERSCRRCLNGGRCVGTNQCQCPEGFSGEWCQYKAKDDFLLFAQSGSVKRLTVPYRSRHFGYLHTAYGNNIIGVDYDCKEKLVYYADVTRGEIGSVTYNGLNEKIVIKNLLSPEGVTIDWLGRNIFWVDSRAKTINVASINGHYTKNLFYNSINRPRAITNHPIKGKVFWSDWDRKNPRIECSNMDGTDRVVLVNSSNVETPNGLAINYINDELCWTDAGKKQIACIDLGGSGNIRVLVTKLTYPFSLTFRREHLFWTDWKSDDIQRMNIKKMSRGTGLQTGISYDGQLYDIKSVQSCPKGCEEADYNYKGNDIKTIENIYSTAECNKLCRQTEGCQYFTLFTKDYATKAFTNLCFLKTSNSGRVYNTKGVISGGINCEVEASNLCSHNNGECQYLCLMKGATGKSCAEPDEVNLTVTEDDESP